MPVALQQGFFVLLSNTDKMTYNSPLSIGTPPGGAVMKNENN